MSTGHNAKLFQERRGLRRTLRGPGPAIAPYDNLVHHEPLDPPLPIPEVINEEGTQPPVTGGVTQPWPHGTKEPV